MMQQQITEPRDASADDKKSYLSVVTAYMVSGGFHSLHEVLGPVAMCLPEETLLPGYKVSLPRTDERCEPPNYNAFYTQIAQIDGEFEDVIESGWEKLNVFFEDEYVKKAENIPSYNEFSGNIKNKVISGIRDYQNRSKGFFSYTLNLDSARGDIRARTYISLLSDSKSKFESLAISYALLASSDGGTLKGKVADHLGYKNPIEARNVLKKLLKEEMREILSIESEDKLEGRLSEALTDLNHSLKTIVTLANTKQRYTNSGVRGKFDGPLSWLEDFARKSEQEDNRLNF